MAIPRCSWSSTRRFLISWASVARSVLICPTSCRKFEDTCIITSSWILWDEKSFEVAFGCSIKCSSVFSCSLCTFVFLSFLCCLVCILLSIWDTIHIIRPTMFNFHLMAKFKSSFWEFSIEVRLYFIPQVGSLYQLWKRFSSLLGFSDRELVWGHLKIGKVKGSYCNLYQKTHHP